MMDASAWRSRSASGRIVRHLPAGVGVLKISLWAAALTPFLAAPSSSCGEYERLSRSIFWQPYRYDESVVALYHLDDKGVQTGKDDLDLADPAEEDGIILKESEKKDDGGVRNDHAMGPSGVMKGYCEYVPDGRFNGGLAFKGLDGLVMGFDSKTSKARTLEYWLKLDELPKSETALMYLYSKDQPKTAPIQLLLKSDGALQVLWHGKAPWPATDLKLVPGRWTHLALNWRLEWPEGVDSALFIDGFEIQRHRFSEPIGPSASINAFIAGNSPEQKHGFKGIIDEIRFSNRGHSYYRYDLAWTDPGRKWETPAGQPFFRDAADLLFRDGFNKALKPDVCDKETKFKEHAVTAEDERLTPAKVRTLFPDGVEGAALMTGEGSLSPSFTGAGNFQTARGTIAFWLQPLDWDNFTRDNRFDTMQPLTFGLFQIYGEYMEGSYDRQFRASGPLLEFNINLNMDEGANNPPELCPGRWIHVAAVWEGTEFKYYVDGKPRSPDGAWSLWLPIYPGHDPRNPANPEWWLNAKPQTIRFGPCTYWEQRKVPAPRCALDDFRVYSRALSQEEIANLLRIFDPRQKMEPLPAASMSLYYNGVSGIVKTDIMPLLDKYKEVASVEVKVLKEGGKDALGSSSLKFEGRNQGTVEVKTPPMDFGSYSVVADLQDSAGKALCSVERKFTRKPPPWWQCKAGISDKVMPDWPPMEVAGNVIKVYGREIYLAASGLPEKIISQGADILAGPVKLTAASGGKDIQLAPEAPQPEITSKKEVRVDARGGLKAADFSIGVKSYTEFDGMMWFTITLAPAEGKTPSLDGMTLTIPFAEGNADYMHWWSGDREFRNPKSVHIGAVPEKDGTVFRSNDTDSITKLKEMRGSFIPYLLVTGQKRGMAWFAENDKGWTQSDAVPAVSVERKGKAATLILRIICSEIRLAEPRTISFGLHPTPVKKLDPIWRNYPVYSNLNPDSFCGNNLKGRPGPTDFALYPEDGWEGVRRRLDGEGATTTPIKKKYEEQLEAAKKQGISDPPPQTLTVAGLYWDLQWNAIPDSADAREWRETWALNYQFYTPDFLDFCSWAWNEWIVKTDKDVKGAYMDDCWGAPITREGAPCTYQLEDGHVQPGFQFLGYRERIKRMRQISWDNGIFPHLTSHTTHTFYIPYHSFFDLILDGEDFYSTPPSQGDFLDHWPPDRMQFMHNEKWGLVTTWLGWCGGGLKIDKWPSWTFRQQRAYAANMALHDIIWAFDEKILKDFGLKEPGTVFVPYWNDGGLAKHTHKDFMVSAWKRPGKCMVLLVNRASDRIEANVKLDMKAMGFDGKNPGDIKIQHADPTLLTYFDEDATTVKKPEMNTKDNMIEDGEKPGDEISLDERIEDMDKDKRTAQDPDGRFEWKDGTLSCAVRRHDYRLFIFSAP